MKVGDLVKFKGTHLGPFGVILSFKNLSEPPHPSQPDQRSALIEWANKHTSTGHYQLSILEVVSESR